MCVRVCVFSFYFVIFFSLLFFLSLSLPLRCFFSFLFSAFIIFFFFLSLNKQQKNESEERSAKWVAWHESYGKGVKEMGKCNDMLNLFECAQLKNEFLFNNISMGRGSFFFAFYFFISFISFFAALSNFL